MKRRMRRSLRKIERKFSQAKSFTASLVRSNSSYHYSYTASPPISPTYAASISDDDDDDESVFGPVSPVESSVDDVLRSPVTLIPCEFCHIQQPSRTLMRHESSCLQNPSYSRVRSSTRHHTTSGRRRRAVSDSVSPPPPSAPPRSRSSSITDDISVPDHLICPITGAMFHDPVVASDGHTYERTAIHRCLQRDRMSPITRQPMSIGNLIQNRIVKQMVDEFREECRRKKLLYKFKLNIDVKKTEEMPITRTNTKSIYRGEWIRKPSPSMNPNIYLVHLIGENAEKISNMSCRIKPHSNIVATFGRVEHNDTGVLLAQEYLADETLSHLINNSPEKLSLNIMDTIVYQIALALQHINKSQTIYGTITSDDIVICKFHDTDPEGITIKLANIGNTGSDESSRDVCSEKSDIYTFGEFAQALYSSQLEISRECLDEREALFLHCLENDPNERPTFDELIEVISKFTGDDKSKSS
ncbi:unnamed protein product [Rotaria magnacalcarata]|uniref:U-box domain-containing protein n=2 Tax=Rotaria magnacalcarata TaxID=392030 RepID=A0A816W4G1_9BILA|nr:unnamed protein product [Rotaria magnacalcarata]CAF2132690.1 unnamed protein product [Rotaria magnacalcarata]CAF3885083.1 unnamed protein product [Rotaria magnacalcarata]CAF3913433.1 unnamed protein product [Rotaria magnacalcarata]